MPALPAATTFTAPAVTEGGFKTAITEQREFLAGLLGTDGTQAAALTAIGAVLNGVLTKTAAYTVAAADRGKLIDYTTAGFTLSLLAAATAGAGFVVAVRNSASTGNVTIDPNASEQIDGATTIALAAGESCVCVCTGTAWKTVGRSSAAPQLRTVIFSSGSGNWTVPAGVTEIEALVVGGGGGGGYFDTVQSWPGRDGGLAHGIYSVTPGQVLSRTVGAGGAGSTTGQGSAGGASSLGSLLSATGGGVSSSGGVNGVGTGGTVRNGVASAGSAGIGGARRHLAVSSTGAISFAGTNFHPGCGGASEVTQGGNDSTGGVGGAILIRYVGA